MGEGCHLSHGANPGVVPNRQLGVSQSTAIDVNTATSPEPVPRGRRQIGETAPGPALWGALRFDVTVVPDMILPPV